MKRNRFLIIAAALILAVISLTACTVDIDDVNAVINAILSGGSNSNADVNGDGEVNIADVNAVITAILG